MPSDHVTPQSLPQPPSQSRKPRQDPKASHDTDLHHVSTNQVLQSSHYTASQTQDLTVFSDLTDPPVSTSVPENKGLSGDIQGGLSGLYNKLRATVAGTKELEIIQKPVTAEVISADGPSTHTSSGRTSRVQSPRVSAFDSSTRADISKFAPGSASVMKLNLPSPGIRSPNGPAHLAGPALTELNILATVNNKSHSRAGSSQEADENAQPDRLLLSPTDEQNLRKVLTKAEQDSRLASQDRRVRSPQPPLTKLDTKNIASMSTHSRGVSESSNQDGKGKTLRKNVLSPASASKDHPLNQFGSNKNSPVDQRSPTRHSTSLIPEVKADASTKSTQIASGSTRNPRDATSRSRNRISQSRLPGYPVSRTSSTDSGLASSTLTLSKDSHPINRDGQADVPLQITSSRSSNRLKSHVIERAFWMKDENARECYSCGEPFTTFRRKHHCRTCGQIFDNKCTTLVSGLFFDLPGAVRVCRQCEAIIISHEDDSSDFSDDPTTADASARPQTPDFSAARYDDDNVSMVSQSLEHIARTPVMSLPVRRAYDKNNRSSAILEFDVQDHILHRPSSSRSLRTSHTFGHGHGHKRHHSKHQYIRSFKPYHEDRVPFQRVTQDDLRDKTSAFHRDSIIDPELAQYLSDDPSSEEETVLRPSHSADKLSRSGPDSDRTAIGGLLAAMRKGRSRMGDRSIAGFLNFNREADDAASIISNRAIEGARSSRKRNLSVASSIHHKMTPRTTRERVQIVLPPGHDSDTPASPVFSRSGPRIIRSSSMRGVSAPSLELNRASVQHVHKMLRQLLRDAEVPKVSNWEDALIPILLRATDDVDPNVQDGDDIDIRSYVKLKKIPGGRPADTSYTSGLIFTKNVALKSMQRAIPNPRILIITFALEYARSESHFMSLDPVIRQEREYLGNLVARIAALKPDVLLAEKNVSGLALELLEKANIAVVFNVKRAVLEAVSRCTETAVHNSVDKLTVPTQELGTCELFEVKTYRAEGRRKTYIYISGCPPELGCTIALRGASKEVLDKIKRLTDFMIYVVYNLKLETCLMRDEWALIPSNDNLSRSSVTSTTQRPLKLCDLPLPQAQNNTDTEQGQNVHLRGGTLESDVKVNGPPEVRRFATNDSSEIPDDIPVPVFYQELADKHETRILSASPFVKFAQPYLLMRAREFERRVAYFKRLRDQDLSDSLSLEEKAKAQKFTLITPEMVHSSLKGTSRKVREIVHAVHDAEYEKALFHYNQQKKQWEAHLSNNQNLFDPYAHQNICVLFSMISTHTNIPCSGPDMVAFSFYNEHEYEEGFEPDCTLGQYVEDLCYRANDSCSTSACPKRMFEHHRQYVHGEAQITVFVEPHPPKLRGLQDVILMWSTCKICGTETTVAPMSPSTWKYSFGKYLELSFWSADLHARAGGCEHDLHRDHLRYFGYKGFALRVHYDPIDLLEIIVPRMRITWKVDNDLRFRNELFTKLEHRITKFMGSVKLRLKSVNIDALLPESTEACQVEVERLTKQANEDHTTLIKHLQERYTNSRHWEVIPLNSALRALQEKVADWDEAFTDFEKNFFPSEKDIRRLATLQLKKIFLDRDVSVTSLTSGEDESLSPTEAESINEKQPLQDDSASPTRKLSPEKTQNVLESVVEEHPITPQANDEKTEISFLSSPKQIKAASSDPRRASADLPHLDLAVHDVTPRASVQTVTEPQDIAKTEGDAILASPDTADQTFNAIKGDDGHSGPELVINGQAAAPEIVKLPSLLSKSQLPTPSQPSTRQNTASRPNSPSLIRAQSHPTGSLPLRKDFVQAKPSTMSAINATNGFGSNIERKNADINQEPTEKKLSERFGLSSLKSKKIMKGQSLIPRAISGRKESRVSNLAKHFEQLSREFEQARLKERKERAARNKRSQIYPLAAPKPIVEVYKSVNDAVDEVDESEETLDFPENITIETKRSMAQDLANTKPPTDAGHNFHTQVTVDHPSEAKHDEETQPPSHAPSEAGDRTDIEEEDGDEDHDDEIYLPDSPEDLLRLSQEDAEFKDLQKHERSSLMKMLTNFWAERSSSGWAPLEYPLHTSDHIFTDCDIIVREDELSSIIAFALDSSDYNRMLHNIQDRYVPAHRLANSFGTEDANEDEDVISHSLLRKTGTHLKYQFTEGPAKMLCKVFFAEQFDAMRRKCGVADRFVESLSRCMKFDSKGGKSRSLFLKTLDDRFVLKSLSPVETQSFLKFAPNYFQIMSEAFFHDLPSVIAKMLGFYQIIIKNPATGVEHNWYLLVMENLFYDRTPTRIFDLKGSMRNRKINATGERNEVLLDENMVEFIYESPLFAREHSKKVLRSSVHNDTLFLARQNVMDYSLMIAIDEHKRELVVGIIDCIRTYTWDKKLESWIKDRGFVNAIVSASSGLGGGGGVRGTGNRPTVTSPKEYKRRFREAMGRYVLEAPSCWHQFKPRQLKAEEGDKKERTMKDGYEFGGEEMQQTAS